MSDTFDHEADAWESYEQGREDDGPYSSGRGRSSHNYDPLFYHQQIKFKRMSNTTAKAVELELMDGRLIWLPRSVCQEWGEGKVYVHRATLNKSMRNARKPLNPDELADLLPAYPED